MGLVTTKFQHYVIDQMQKRLDQAFFELTEERVKDKDVDPMFNDGYYTALNDISQKIEDIVNFYYYKDLMQFFNVREK